MTEDANLESVKLPPNCRLHHGPGRPEEGRWREAVVSGGEHLKRVLLEYVELGFECLLQEVDPAEVEGCARCFKTGGERMYRVFVRRRAHPAG